MRTINEIIVHCSATPEGKKFTSKDIEKWHLKRGFKKIGYHYVVLLDGTVETGRKEFEVGAHCEGHNTKSIGICYIGGLNITGKAPKDTRTPEQKKALMTLLINLKEKYPKAVIHGHRDFANKACPSFDATSEYKDI